MKNFIINKNFIIGFIITLLNSCSSQQPVYKCLWQANDFSTDSITKTLSPLRFCDNNSKLQYNITNNNKNIYICIKATDEQYQMKIILAGMQINIDTSGKGALHACIKFPIADNEKPQMTSDFKPGQKKIKKGNPIKDQFLLKHKEMLLSGFKSPISGTVPLKNKYGISADIDWDSLNIMYYKAIIPFSTFYKDSLTVSDSSKIFNLSFTVNAIEMPVNTMKGPPGGGDMPESGNMPGGGMGGGGMGNGGPPRGGVGTGMQVDNSLSEKNIIKVKIKMALK